MDYISEIKRLKKERDAVILAHNYCVPEIQDIADITGDSLGLSIDAANTENSVIVFCGVHFMAETAFMLAPDKTVLLPAADAGCPMADMVEATALKELKAKHPGVPVVCYVNSSAAVKAESDICCTSANAVNVVQSIDSNKIIFVPDKNLGHYVSRFTDKEIILWDGYCPVHDKSTAEDVAKLKIENPDALVVAHPECPAGVIDLADHVCSTSGIFEYCKNSDSDTFIICTEMGVNHRLQKENPDKTFLYAYKEFICEDMKKTGLKELYECLKDMKNSVTVDEDVRVKGVKSIERMLEVPRNH